MNTMHDLLREDPEAYAAVVALGDTLVWWVPGGSDPSVFEGITRSPGIGWQIWVIEDGDERVRHIDSIELRDFRHAMEKALSNTEE